MSVYNGLHLLKKTKDIQSAVPSLDSAGGNVDILNGIFSQLEAFNATAFISSTPESIKSYYGMDNYINLIKEVSKNYKVDFSIHLDHATDPDIVVKAIESGFSSVMYDGSALPFRENINTTKDIILEAKKRNVSVEAELGVIGGKEDEIFNEKTLLPSYEDCINFVNETEVEFFAPAIGTLHGLYKIEPDIDWELIDRLFKSCDAELVLHGGTGLKVRSLKKLIDKGFIKINYATGIREAFTNGIRKTISGTEKQIKPQKYLKSGREAVSCYVSNILKVLTDEKTPINHRPL